MRHLVKIRKKVQMNQKETFDGTVKNHDLNLRIGFDCCDDLTHLRKHLRAENVERRLVKRNSPIFGERLTRRTSAVFVAV